MKKPEAEKPIVTEEMIKKYYTLNKQVKEIEKELARLKKIFNHYFDLSVGVNEKGRLDFNAYVVQRQVRVAESYQERSSKEIGRYEFKRLHTG